jgi:hypothetical protein
MSAPALKLNVDSGREGLLGHYQQFVGQGILGSPHES